ncbi:hypothetical protein [Mesorhizobium sp.]|uniref:hypothetical protein n=1 Tax=Mesorhizobium sp. TaxID=1871066 RepID=UPI002579D712|nr:hypothetical protein [Mesorhizobium sp.]
MPNHRVPAAGEAVPVDPPNRTRRRNAGVSARWRPCMRWTDYILFFPGAQFEESRI